MAAPTPFSFPANRTPTVAVAFREIDRAALLTDPLLHGLGASREALGAIAMADIERADLVLVQGRTYGFRVVCRTRADGRTGVTLFPRQGAVRRIDCRTVVVLVNGVVRGLRDAEADNARPAIVETYRAEEWAETVAEIAARDADDPAGPAR